MTTDLKIIHAQRNQTHGDFAMNSKICQDTLDLLYSHSNYANLSATKREAIRNVIAKVARIVSGDSDHLDSWVDIQGYAGLIVKELEAKNTEPEEAFGIIKSRRVKILTDLEVFEDE